MASLEMYLVHGDALLNDLMSEDYISHYGRKGMHWYEHIYGDYQEHAVYAGKINESSSHAKDIKDIIADAKTVNGGTKGYKYGYNRTRNCAFCSIAYEMRRRGFDVRAQEALHGVSDEAIESAVQKFDKSRIKRDAIRTDTDAYKGMTKAEYDNFKTKILADGLNTRGQILLNWRAVSPGMPYSGGHTVNYEVRNGKFNLVDGQIGKVFNEKQAYKYLKDACNIESYRTDDVDLNRNITDKYYTEANKPYKVNINKPKQTANNLMKVSNGLYTASVASSLASVATIPYIPQAFPFPAALAVVTRVASAGFEAGSVHASKKAMANDAEHASALKRKWEQEGRETFYNADTLVEKPGKSKKIPEVITSNELYGGQKPSNRLSNSQRSRMQSMISSGRYTNAEIAKMLGVSESTVSKMNNA